jgi:hypothetical protein
MIVSISIDSLKRVFGMYSCNAWRRDGTQTQCMRVLVLAIREHERETGGQDTGRRAHTWARFGLTAKTPDLYRLLCPKLISLPQISSAEW